MDAIYRQLNLDPNASPTIVLLKSRDYVFGGYASHAWNTNNLVYNAYYLHYS